MTGVSTSDPLDEAAVGLCRGFGVVLGMYVAYRLIMWARAGQPIDEYRRTITVDADVDEAAEADVDDAASSSSSDDEDGEGADYEVTD